MLKLAANITTGKPVGVVYVKGIESVPPVMEFVRMLIIVEKECVWAVRPFAVGVTVVKRSIAPAASVLVKHRFGKVMVRCSTGLLRGGNEL